MEKNRKILLAVAAIIVVIAVIAAAVSLSQPASGEKELTVYAATSLTAAFNDLIQKYEENHTDVKITPQFAGSQVLKNQILQGANPDVFASADTINMEGVSNAKLMDNSTIQTFAKNRVVLIVPAANPGDIDSLLDLADKNVKIVIGVETVPIGNYTRTVLNKLTAEGGEYDNYYNNVMDHVVSQETNVGVVVSKVSMGEADAGFVYATDAASAGSAVKTFDIIPDEDNVVATYPIGVLAGSHLSAEAQDFIDFVMSPDGQNILASYGFIKVA